MSRPALRAALALLPGLATALTISPEPSDAVPARERGFFEGTYEYYSNQPVRCTLLAEDGTRGRFTVYWSAYWPSKDKDDGPNDQGWYAYRGPLSIASDGAVAGKAKYHTFSGTATGTWPTLGFELTYTGGRKDYTGPRTMTLRPRSRPGEKAELAGILQAIDWAAGTATLQLPVEGEAPATAQTLVLLPETAVAAGRRRVPLALLHQGAPCQVAGWKTEEGVLAVQLALVEPEEWTGEITAVDPAALTITALARPKSDRKAETRTVTIACRHLGEIRPVASRAKTLEDALAEIAVGQKLSAGAYDGTGAVLQGVWVRTSR